MVDPYSEPKIREIWLVARTSVSLSSKETGNQAWWMKEDRVSSTACILAHNDGILHAPNVGDSGFMLFSNKKFIYRSPIQQRRFNCPYKLGNSEESDGPDCARELKIAVVAGDVIVLGTDELLDNMFAREIEEVLKGESKTKGGIQPKELAVLIADLSLYNSFDKYTKNFCFKCSYSVASAMMILVE
ncbi:PPM-type phosphatase domain containing protein [Parasponia andersonii]|uniref:Protein phosphatase n=1 Tax=Parasponia andersonii TaxID=3476 RepID=A0A2P5DQV2_PARAD|nr:PPM-type phosphatase domain containing protein [Parasponia andersonii]